MLTADTITDEQIRELRATPGLTLDMRAECDLAIGAIARHPLRSTSYTATDARARCAEIINTRASKGK